MNEFRSVCLSRIVVLLRYTLIYVRFRMTALAIKMEFYLLNRKCGGNAIICISRASSK